MLEREHIVDTITGHRDGPLPQMQRIDHRLLLRRRHPSEHTVVIDRTGKLLGILGQLPRVDRVIGAGDTRSFCDRTHRRGVIPGDHLHRDALVEEVADGVRSIRAQHLIDDDERDRFNGARTRIR